MIEGQHVTVTPFAAQGNLPTGGSIMLGYCASQTGANLVAVPGHCDQGVGTVVTQDTNENVDPSQVEGAEAKTQVVVSQPGWQALEGHVAYAPCVFAAPSVDATGAELRMSLTSSEDATLACGAVIAGDAETFDAAALPVRVASQPGTVTSIGQTLRTDAGLQGLVLRASAADANHVALTLWRDGVAQQQSLDVPVTLTDGIHFFAWHWSAAGLSITVDDMVISQQPDARAPTTPTARRWVSLTPGQVGDAMFAL